MDEKAFGEYLRRITTKNTTYSSFINRLKTSVGIISNGTLWALPSQASLIADILDIADIKFATKISGFLGKISFVTDIFKDIYNPYLTDEQVTYNFAVYLMVAMGNVGATKFVADAAISATTASGGNVVVGIIAGVIAYMAFYNISKTFSDGMIFT